MKRNKRSKQKADGEISSAETVNLSVVSEKAEPDPEKQRVVLPDGKGRATDADPSVDAEPLRDYIDDGTTAPLVSAKFGKSKIDVYRRGAVTELSEDLGIPSELLSSDCNSAVSALAKEIGVAKSVCGASTAYKRKAVADEGILYVGDNLGDRAVREESPMSVGMNGVSEKGISVSDGEIRRIPSLLKGCAAHRKVRKFNGVGVLAGKIALAVLLFVLALTGAGQPLWLIFALAFAVDALAVLNAFRLTKLAV